MTETECRSIYRSVFCDPDTRFEEMLFSYCYRYCRTYESENQTASMLFLLPIKIKTDKTEYSGAYLYAAATKTEFRKKGYMSNLIQSAKTQYDFILLRPAENSLVSYYSKFGFKTVTAGDFSDAPEIIPQDGYKSLVEESKTNDLNQQFTAMYYSKNDLHLEKINFNYSMN